MLHEPAVKLEADHASSQKTKLGLILFFVYALIYAGFVIIGLSYTHLLSIIIVAGLNLAVVYGIGLIILAIVMGFVYNLVCTSMENKMEREARK